MLELVYSFVLVAIVTLVTLVGLGALVILAVFAVHYASCWTFLIYSNLFLPPNLTSFPLLYKLKCVFIRKYRFLLINVVTSEVSGLNPLVVRSRRQCTPLACRFLHWGFFTYARGMDHVISDQMYQ